MSILPPLSTPPLNASTLLDILSSNVVSPSATHLLRWLIWFPLLSVEELTRLEQARCAHQKRTRSPQRIAAQLKQLETHHLVFHLVINEPGWPPHHHRYAITDAGLYVFAAKVDPLLSVARLAQGYAIERADLVARLARLDIHLVLAHFSTRLLCEGQALGYQLNSYQQPWSQTDSLLGRRQVVRCEAVFLLTSPQGTEHAFYVRVHAGKGVVFDRARERAFLIKLLNLRHMFQLQHEAMPRLLIITIPAHLEEWARMFDRVSTLQNTAPLDGAIITLERLLKNPLDDPVWWGIPDLVKGMSQQGLNGTLPPSLSLLQLLGPAASASLSERFSQRSTFTHLLAQRQKHPLRATARPLPTYIGKSLALELPSLQGSTLAHALKGTRAEQLEATALLNLALSATQKELLSWLTHHPLLTVEHLTRLQPPGSTRGTRSQLLGLANLHLLVPFTWWAQKDWQVRERYVLSEAALRYSALREGLSGTRYLLREEERKKYREPAFAIQYGTAGLFAQMPHTHGVYSSMTTLFQASQNEPLLIVNWKSAREAVRSYRDPFNDAVMQIRPDAELMYLVEGEVLPRILLIEYERAKKSRRDYEAKIQVYVDYETYTSLLLPPLLFITLKEQAAALIRACLDDLGKPLTVTILLENRLLQDGWKFLLP